MKQECVLQTNYLKESLIPNQMIKIQSNKLSEETPLT